MRYLSSLHGAGCLVWSLGKGEGNAVKRSDHQLGECSRSLNLRWRLVRQCPPILPSTACNAHAAIAAILLSMCAVTVQAQEKQQPPDSVQKACRLRMNGQLDEAKQLLEKELAESPAAEAWYELARLEFQRAGKTHDLEAAQKAIVQATASAPDNGLYHRWASRIATYNSILKAHAGKETEQQDQLQIAIDAANRAVEIDPNDVEARKLLVALYGNNPAKLRGNSRLAEEHVQFLEKNFPIDGVEARCELSLKGQTEKRIALWTTLAAKHPNDPRIHRHLAREYAQLGNVEQATVHADKTLSLSSAEGAVLLDVARSLVQAKKPQPAEAFVQRYLTLDPPPPLALRAWAHMAWGQIQRMTGNNEASAHSLAKAKELDPYCWFTVSPPPEQLFDAQ